MKLLGLRLDWALVILTVLVYLLRVTEIMWEFSPSSSMNYLSRFAGDLFGLWRLCLALVLPFAGIVANITNKDNLSGFSIPSFFANLFLLLMGCYFFWRPCTMRCRNHENEL